MTSKDVILHTKMWKTLSTIYGGDDNIQRAKRESLGGNFDEMKMEEGENVAQYGVRMKEIVSEKGVYEVSYKKKQ